MPSVTPILPWLRPGWIGVEIGVAEGYSAAAMLDLGVGFLYLVDPWENYEGFHEGSSDSVMQACLERLAPYSASGYRVMRMSSAAAAPVIPDRLDFCWIDGNHRYEWVKSDLETYWPKIRQGGVLCGHDYCMSPPACQVKQAVDEFAAARGLFVGQTEDCWVIVK